MDNPTSLALSRLTVQARAIDIVANNLANVATPGFQAERQVVADWLSRQTATAAPRGGKTQIFPQDRATYRDPARGTLTHTGNPLDLAIGTDGYFSLQTPQGVRLTRAGAFTTDATGTITNGAGFALLDTNAQPIKLPPGAIDLHVAGDGTLSARVGAQNTQIAKIAIVAPTDPYAPRAQGNHLLDPNGPTNPVARPAIVQGAMEDSNVQPIAEMTKLIDAQREFQMLTQFIEAEGQRRQTAVSKLADIGLGA